MPAVYAANSFPDVTSDSPYYTAIEYFKESGVIEGYTDGTFRPDQEANRAEALKIVLLASSVSVEDVFLGLNVFPDVSPEDWHYPYIKTAKELDYVEGYPDGDFKPEKVQNIAETLKLILLTNDIDGIEVDVNETIYPDVTGEVWFAPYAAYSKEKNIIEPGDDAKLHAERGITRGELVEMMYRMEIVLQNGGDPFDISTNWPTVSYPQHAFKSKLPFTWEVVENADEVVFWRRDEINHQSSYEVSFPYSASMTFHLDNNEDGLSPANYEANLDMVYKSDFGSYQKNSLTIAGNQAIEFNVSVDHDDYFVFLPENRVLHIYTSYGWSDLTEQLQAEMDKILESLEYITPGSGSTSSGNVLSDARDRILVEGLGQETLNMFSDLVNIETDTIGVGTGPVDYFYSAQYDVTIKYERNSDTILDIQDGETSAF
ncbi:S-layer homology domain-containing protein [Patescibacteria group bacterium]